VSIVDLMVANDQLSVRVVLLNDDQCPKVSVNDVPTAMQLRAPKAMNFPAVCDSPHWAK
jgi:hypothetical protein